MEATISRFPCGELEGAPSLELRVSQLSDPDDLTAMVAANIRPGISVVHLREAPWGSAEWDQALHRLLARPAHAHLTLAAVRSVGEERWSNIRIHWIGDVTTLLRERITSSAVAAAIGGLPYFPPLRELVVYRPALDNVRPTVLDELQGGLDYEGGGYIYAPPGDTPYLETALGALTRCASPWALRIDRARGDDKA